MLTMGEEKPKQEKREGRLGAVKLLDSVKTQRLPKKPPSISLLFGKVMVRNTKLYALVDTDASNMLLSSKAARSLGLRVEATGHWFKMVNSDDVPAIGIARNVELHVSDWKGKLSFKVIPLGEYDLWRSRR